jgi:hypothetical protein
MIMMKLHLTNVLFPIQVNCLSEDILGRNTKNMQPALAIGSGHWDYKR